ncbi:hypothetical protein GBA52_002828 [Prunus armeniaca]|nr:hypothetical protein GBA52_002828 [Prunus armeniaca]
MKNWRARCVRTYLGTLQLVGGVSDGGFMDEESMNMLIAEPKHKHRWNSGYHFERVFLERQGWLHRKLS